MRLPILVVLLSLALKCKSEDQKPSLSQRIARWLWSPGNQPGGGPNQGRAQGHAIAQNQDNCLPCNKIPWVPIARALGHVPATYQSHGSKYTFHLPTIGIMPLRQSSNTYGPPKPEYGPPPPKQEYGPPPSKQEYGPPPQKPEYGPPKFEYGLPKAPKAEFGPPTQDFGSIINPIKQAFIPPELQPPSPNFDQPKPPNNVQLHFIPQKPDFGQLPKDLGPPKLVYGVPNLDYVPPKPDYGPPKQEFGPPKQEYGPPKSEQGPPKPEYGPPKQEYGPPKTDFRPPKLEFGPPKPEYGPPKSEYGPPKSEYGPPKSEYGPPKPEYGPPKSEYGPPKSEYGPPKLEYGPPKLEYGPPKTEYGPPKQEFPNPKPSYGPHKPDYGPPKQQYGPPSSLKFSYGSNQGKGGYRMPAPRFQGAPLTLLTPPKLPFQLQNPSTHQATSEAMSYQSFHQYLSPPHAPNGPNIKHEHTIVHSQNNRPFNIHSNNPQPVLLSLSQQSHACNKCPSGPNLAPGPHTHGVEDATIEVGNFGDLPLSDSAHEASSSVTTSHNLPITEVSVTKSVPISEYLSSIEFPVQIIQAPLLDIPELPKYISLGYGDGRLKAPYQQENTIRNLRDEGGKIPDSDKASSLKQALLSNANSIHTNHKVEDNFKGYIPTTPAPGYHYYTIQEQSQTIGDTINPTFISTSAPPSFPPTESSNSETNAHGPMQHFEIYNSTYVDDHTETDIRLMDGPSRQPPPQKAVSWTTIASSQARPFSTQTSHIDEIVVPYAALQKVDLPVNNQGRKVPTDPLRQPDIQAMMVNRGFSSSAFHVPTGTEHIEPVDLPRLIDTLPPDVANKLRELVEKHGESELRHIIADNLQDLLRKEEDSVDIVRLQKNIDNWTAEGFRRAFTNLPHFDSKKIPDEYLTTSMPDYEASGSHLDPVTKKNGTDYVKVIKGWALVETKVMTSTEVTPQRQPWEHLEVSISPLTKEKVYVVTPLNSRIHPTTIPPDLPNRITRESAKSTKGTEATTTPIPTVSTTTVRSPRNADNLIDGVTASVRYLGRNGR